MREEVVDDGIEELGREYRGGRIGISVEIVEVSEGVACDAGSEALDREGSNDNSEIVGREGSTIGVILRREIVECSVDPSSWRTLIYLHALSYHSVIRNVNQPCSLVKLRNRRF